MCIVLIKHLMLTARETAQINNMLDKGFCAHRLLGFSSVHVDQHNLNIILLVVGVSQCFFSFGENSHPIKTPTPTHIL